MNKEVLQGKIQGNRRGYAFLILSDDSGVDYFIPHSNLRGAMHGDIVFAETTKGDGYRTTARVLKVVEHGIKEIVGTYFTCRTGGFVVPDDDKYYVDIFIPFGKGERAKNGDKVVCKILSYPKKKNPEGVVTKILGRQFEKSAELKSILYSYKLPEKFPSNVIKDSLDIIGEISEQEIKNRKDLRKDFIFTIDGESAKDFDDAVSIEKLSDHYVLGVHIADVSHYVKQGGFIDNEAFNRGTSVYFPESVIPMLPERLCNDLCSLRPNEDRLTLSCIMKVDYIGNVVDVEIVPSIINSKHRLTYNYVNNVLEGVECCQNEQLFNALALMNELADILIKKRDDKGNVDLDVKESLIEVKKGEIFVSKEERNKAHKIIEEFMICANVSIAEYFYYLQLPFVYRVHGKPTEEKLENFYAFLDGLGVKYKRRKGEIFSKDFQLILKNATDDKVSIINRVMLRSMQKAKYSPICDGHFGLSEKFYCHFTSPIRRYPDLVIHRIIKDFIRNGSNNLVQKYGEFVFSASAKSSEREKIAQDAELAVDDYYKLLYISGYEGEEFDGVVSGVTNFGIFVELENCIEGLVKIETLPGRGYVFDRDRYCLSNAKKSFNLGQKVRIMVAGVNLIDKRAEFVLI